MIQLKRYRLELDKTQAYIAKCLGISQQTYANYENAETQAPHDILIKAADYFKISVDELLGRDTEKVATPVYTKAQQSLVDKVKYLNDDQCLTLCSIIETFGNDNKQILSDYNQLKKYED